MSCFYTFGGVYFLFDLILYIDDLFSINIQGSPLSVKTEEPAGPAFVVLSHCPSNMACIPLQLPFFWEFFEGRSYVMFFFHLHYFRKAPKPQLLIKLLFETLSYLNWDLSHDSRLLWKYKEEFHWYDDITDEAIRLFKSFWHGKPIHEVFSRINNSFKPNTLSGNYFKIIYNLSVCPTFKFLFSS